MRKIMLFLTAIVLLSSVFGGFSLCEVPNETVALASQEEVAITTLLSKTEFSANETLTAEFTFEGKVKKWYYEADGVEVVKLGKLIC